MFQILNLWHEISFGIVAGIYGTVMKIYDILYDIAKNTNQYINMDLEAFTSGLYVVAGVFMLFRVVIGLVQMLLNPDQITDKQVGTGKMITRIVACIVMLLAFQPNGILFGENGLLNRIENALLQDDSIIYQIVNPDTKVDLSVDNNEEYNLVSPDKTNILFVGNVYADDDGWTKKCWYHGKITSKKEVVDNNSSDRGSKKKTVIKAKEQKQFVAIFSNQDNGGLKVSGREKDSPLYVKFEEVTETYENKNGKTISVKFTKPGFTIATQTVWDLGSANGYKVGDCGNWQILASGSTMTLSYKKNGKPKDNMYYGYNSWKDYKNAYLKDIKSKCKDVAENERTEACEDAANGGLGNLSYASDTALAFAQVAAGSFEECLMDEGNECTEAKQEQFSSTEANEDIINLMDKGDLELDFIMAIIAGIILIIFLAILAIDIIVREFKLLLLEILAPIPIICYADPKDKIFNQWWKMYISVYVDLFIKLIALNFAIVLIGATVNNVQGLNGLYVFFFLIAILVFAKLVPTMISKIFGLDSLGGSFKDIAGMAKKGAGFATGAALTGAVGFATGQGLGRLSGLAKGAIIGGASGAKGNVFGGAQKIGKSNYLDNYGKSKGMSWLDRKIASISGTLGLPDPYERAQEEKASYDNYVSKASKANDEALSTIRKLIGNGQATGKFSDLEEAWAQARVINAGGHIDRYERQANNTYKDTKTGNIIDMNTYNSLSDSEKYLDNEVVEHVKGAEKAAIKQFNAAVESGNYATVGLNASKDAGDIEKHKAFIKSANVAAVQAGYSEHNSDNKTDAETKSAILGTEMDIHEVAHKFKQSK